ncbi:MAG: TusE/DsrC/DsvC family sulfur relay protein [Gammaproteobacteria bacterium]
MLHLVYSSPCGANPLAYLARDEQGFLLDSAQWSAELMEPLAAETGLGMTRPRREIIEYVRACFESNQAVPSVTEILSFMERRWGCSRATRAYLDQLFPMGYQWQTRKIAGLENPAESSPGE